MTLWLDANLSDQIVPALKGALGPLQGLGGLIRSPDDKIWARMCETGATGILSRDVDMARFVEQYGAPPKVIQIGHGIGHRVLRPDGRKLPGWMDVVTALKEAAPEIERFLADPARPFLTFSRPDPKGPLVFADTPDYSHTQKPEPVWPATMPAWRAPVEPTGRATLGDAMPPTVRRMAGARPG